ncbi:MAG: SAM-dependent DNA methyltransferase, partial [Pyrinomonadaceae bacterium]
SWMAEDGLAAWLIPSEFMDVNYGRAIKEYLLNKVTLLSIHRFDPSDVQFDDALVSSAVVWFKKSTPHADHSVEFTYGGTLTKPKMSMRVPKRILHETSKWTRFPQNSHKVTPLQQEI